MSNLIPSYRSDSEKRVTKDKNIESDIAQKCPNDKIWNPRLRYTITQQSQTNILIQQNSLPKFRFITIKTSL